MSILSVKKFARENFKGGARVSRVGADVSSGRTFLSNREIIQD